PHQELTSPEQTVSGKDLSNPLIDDSLLKTIWYSIHHVATMKNWLFQSKRLLGWNYAELEQKQSELMAAPQLEAYHQLVVDTLGTPALVCNLMKVVPQARVYSQVKVVPP
nr:hypothetical protein [Tanacetum cinerariifolium]